MTRKAKSFRFTEQDLNILEAVHTYYKGNFEERASATNTDNLYRWSYAQTIALCIRDRYDALVQEGKIKIEK